MLTSSFPPFGALLLLVLLVAPPASAEPPGPEQRTLGFSTLVVRDTDSSYITGIAEDSLRIFLIEHLRTQGLPVVGAESLLFGRDKTSDADLMLGGTVSNIACAPREGSPSSCRLAVDWEVYDTSEDRVIYRHRSWHGEESGVSGSDTAQLGRRLVVGALEELISRPLFRDLLAAPSQPEGRLAETAQFVPCAAPAADLPANAEWALQAAVVVGNGEGFGSGFLFTSAPLVLTAAHVAKGDTLTVRLKNGQKSRAEVVRRNFASDVALLRLTESVALPGCLRLAQQTPKIGEPLFAFGTPMTEELAFSMTQGIVSGIRQSRGIPLIQTDASISPGYSGGPLATPQGEVVALTSFKVVGGGSEGIAFGIPIDHALDVLGLAPGTAIEESLMKGRTSSSDQQPQQIDDPENEMPALAMSEEAVSEQASFPRFAWGISGTFGPAFAAFGTGPVGGVEARFGAQLTRHVAIHGQPAVLAGEVKGESYRTGFGGTTTPTQVILLATLGAVFEYTVNDMVYLALGPELNIGARGEDFGETTPHPSAIAKAGLRFGKMRPYRRKAFQVGIHTRVIFAGIAPVVVPTLALGYDAF